MTFVYVVVDENDKVVLIYDTMRAADKICRKVPTLRWFIEFVNTGSD